MIPAATPLVSILICLYNGRRYIGDTLRSVFAQTFQDFEVIVVDDGSTDGSAAYVAEAFRDDRLTLVRQENRGQGAALQRAITHARGRWLAFLDHDDLWTPEKLERQLREAAAVPQAALVFSDCLLIDSDGRAFRRVSDQFDFSAIKLDGIHGYDDLLRRGCFITMSTVMARTAAVRRVGGVNPAYRYVLDYDLWLRIARLHPIHYVPEVLGSWRVHDQQFTQRHPEVALAEETHLLRPLLLSASFPRGIRLALGDYLFGRHRDCVRALLRQGRVFAAGRAAVGIVRYPGRVADYCRDQVGHLTGVRIVDVLIDTYLHGRDAFAQAVAHGRNNLRRARRASNRLRRIPVGGPGSGPAISSIPPGRTHVWIDGSPLADAQTGYFNLVAELIRTLVRDHGDRCVVHVATSRAGRAALTSRIGGAAVRFHRPGRSICHWSVAYRLISSPSTQLMAGIIAITLMPVAVAAGLALAALVVLVQLDEAASIVAEGSGRARERWLARVVRFAWRRVPVPYGKAPHPNTIEVVVWRGRFRWHDSTRVAIVQDMIPRIFPELHTPGNVTEFEEFLRDVQRHATVIAANSEQTRQDTVERVAVYPGSVTVMPMPVNPRFVEPAFDPAIPYAHGVTGPFILCVGTIEPRKNLRRLVNAFELLKSEDRLRNVRLVFVGPQGWDNDFRRFVLEHDACPRISILGFIPENDLPSLYHAADAVVYPSLYEGFGLPVLEAMCCSGVVLASRVSALPAILGNDGIQFDPYSTEDIARALLQALTMGEADRLQYRRRCRRRAEQLLETFALQPPLPGMPPRTTAVNA